MAEKRRSSFPPPWKLSSPVPVRQFAPITLARLKEATEYAAYIVEEYGEVYRPILVRLQKELAVMEKSVAPNEGGSKKLRPLPDRASITDDTPLHIKTAARLAFPDGTLSESVLRKAASRRELEYERLGGRIFTTLQWIKEWRKINRYAATKKPSLMRL